MTFTRTNPWLVAVVVSLATFMEVLDTTITNVSLRHIAGSLGAGQDESTWVLTSYLVANGIILPLSGWLSDVMGRKRFFISCIVGFTVASFLCGAATSLPELIIFRILQGAAGGGLQPTQQAIILDTFPPQKRGAVFAITGVTMIIAPILGPTLGGFITDNFSWRWIFYINVPVGLMAAFLVWRLVEEPAHAVAQGAKNIDFLGLGLVTLGLAALQIVLDKGQQDDWFESAFIVAFMLLCVVCLVIAVIWLWGQKAPIIDLSLFKDRAFSGSCLLIFLTGFALYGSSALLPLLLQSEFGYDATLAGLVLSPGGIVLIFLMPVAGKLIAKFEARNLIIIGLVLVAIGMYHTMSLTPQSDYRTFVGMRITQVLGLPFLFIPVSTLAFSNIPREKSNKASALFSMFRNVGGSVGIALASTYVSRAQQIRQNQLASHLYPGNIAYDTMLDRAQTLTGNSDAAHNVIYQALGKQSWILAYTDGFALMCMLLSGAAVFAFFFLPHNRPKALPAESAGVH